MRVISSLKITFTIIKFLQDNIAYRSTNESLRFPPCTAQSPYAYFLRPSFRSGSDFNSMHNTKCHHGCRDEARFLQGWPYSTKQRSGPFQLIRDELGFLTKFLRKLSALTLWVLLQQDTECRFDHKALGTTTYLLPSISASWGLPLWRDLLQSYTDSTQPHTGCSSCSQKAVSHRGLLQHPRNFSSLLMAASFSRNGGFSAAFPCGQTSGALQLFSPRLGDSSQDPGPSREGVSPVPSSDTKLKGQKQKKHTDK